MGDKELYKQTAADLYKKCDELTGRLIDAGKQLANYQWISVKDRMPEPNTEVLIFIPDEEKGLICTDEICRGDWLVFTRENITHWMPLPEPPKEDEEC